MPTTDLTSRQKAVALLSILATLTLVIGIGLLLRRHGPGNMGTGFLQGAGVAIVAALIMVWRVVRAPDTASTFERAFTQRGDEREDAVLTHALAVLGLLSLPLTGIAAVAIGLGADVLMILFFLLVAQIIVSIVAFAVFARRM